MKNLLKIFTFVLATNAMVTAQTIEVANEEPLTPEPKSTYYETKNRIGFAAGNVSGVGLSYERDLFRNFSALFVIGGVAQKSQSDFNTGLTFKYTFSRINKRFSVNVVSGGSYFLDIDDLGVYDNTNENRSLERRRSYIKMGLGLGLTALFFDGRLGIDVNFIGMGASFQKKQNKKDYQLGDKPIRGPQVNLTYHF